MARIKVTGYIDTDDLPPEHVDLSHEMGLSNKGFEAFGVGPSIHGNGVSAGLDDVEFEKEA